MRLKSLKGFTATVFFLITAYSLNAQNCVPTGLNNSIVNSTCSQLCRNLDFQIPDLKSSDDYQIIGTPYDPYPYVVAGGTEDLGLYMDDQFSSAFPLPFPFCFYGQTYTQATVGSNGVISFDISNADCTNAAYNISNPIFFGGGTQCSSNNYYPASAIMAVFSDLDPSLAASPSDRKIQWRVEGTAPCRRFVVSYYKIGAWSSTCGLNGSGNKAATFQVVMYESSGVIDVFIQNKFCVPGGTNGPRAILGVQNETRTKAVAAVGKNATVWTSSNEGYRFVPSGGTSRFVSSQLLKMDLTPIATATTANTTPGLLDLSFPNICTPGPSGQYIIKTTFAACDNPATLLIGFDTITVNLLPEDFVPTITPQAAACAGSNSGSVQITPTTGTAPYSFLVNPGALTQNNVNTANFGGLAPGPYTVVITDANGCTSDPVPFTIGDGAGFTTSVNKTDVLCNGGATGVITVTQPTVGTAPYQYSLDGVTWQASNIFNGLIAGTYTVYYKESTGCQNSQNITIAEPTALSASAATIPVVCNGQSNGTITVTSAGGIAPYQYSINGGTTWQPGNIFNVAAGSYTVTIRDANNCTTTQPATITQPPVLSATSTNGAASCNGGDDGVITVTANGGNAGYQYSIDGTTFQSSNIFNVGPGNYTVTVKDNLGCTTSFPAVITLNNNFTLTPQTDPTICEGTSTQLALVSNATQYSWTPATGLSATNISNPVANPTVTTQYTVNATLGRCNGQDIVIVNVNAAPIPDAGQPGFICFGQTYQLHAAGGSTYSWSPTTFLDDPLSANPISTPTKDITYSLSVVSDANGCASLVTDQVSIDVTPPIKVRTFPYDTVAYAGDQFKLLAVPSDVDATNYLWTPSIGLSDPTIADPIVTAGAIGDVTQYQVTTSTIAGCKGQGYVTVRVYKGPEIYVPTAFTPNGDGKNDKFTPFPVGMKSYKYFRVFNRWGQLMFATTTLNDGWDGTMNGKEQSSGVYVWMIEGTTKDGKLITKKGTITLIR